MKVRVGEGGSGKARVATLERVVVEDVVMRAQGDILRTLVQRHAALVDLLAEKGVVTLDEVAARLLEGAPTLTPAP